MIILSYVVQEFKLIYESLSVLALNSGSPVTNHSFKITEFAWVK